MAARELRKDQDQEFFSHSQANLNTASARGAPDSIASRIPPGLGLASVVLAVWCLLGLVGLVGLARLAGLVCLTCQFFVKFDFLKSIWKGNHCGFFIFSCFFLISKKLMP